MLTARQREVEEVIREYQRAEGVSPSSRTIARRLKISQATAMGHLRALARKSQLEKLADGRWRLKSISLAGGLSELFQIPVYGSIPAGLPAAQEQQPEEIIGISPSVFGATQAQFNEFWFLRVYGDSMTGANIVHGDLVALVRREPRVGEIVAALVDGTETTLKYLVKENDRVLLRAANPHYPDIKPTRLETQGVVIGVIRRKLPTQSNNGMDFRSTSLPA